MADCPYEHVAQIRREKYWIDEQGNTSGINPLAADLQDSIKHLAEGLYTRNAHFIFELIQNAEDNTYGIDIEPSLNFLLLKSDPTCSQNSDGALIIENNEIGFSPENFEAICAVGKSTKSKIQGYIGEKGIGFKSVFRVTSKPYLFSNGYQISLPEEHTETGLGYIVPKVLTVV
jgi:HSP90 family molecular chaperone